LDSKEVVEAVYYSPFFLEQQGLGCGKMEAGEGKEKERKSRELSAGICKSLRKISWLQKNQCLFCLEIL
jgi:hypothetical protein